MSMSNPVRLPWWPACVLLTGCAVSVPPLLAGTTEQVVLPLVATYERSAHLDAVGRHLEWGGTVFGYVDTSNTLEVLTRAAEDFQGLVAAEPEKLGVLRDFLLPSIRNVPFGKVLDGLGLGDVKAIGLSSVEMPDGMYRNRVFLHTPAGRHGLLAVLGGEPTSFRHLQMAPADVDFYYESEVDLPALYAVLRQGVCDIAGEWTSALLERELVEAFVPLGTDLLQLIQSARGRVTVFAVVDPTKMAYLRLDKPMKTAAVSMLLRADGLGKVMLPLLDQIPQLEVSLHDGVRVYAIVGEPILSTWTPAIAVEGDTLYLTSSQAFLFECRSRKSGGLGDSESFALALASCGQTGNRIEYTSPRLLEKLRQIPELNAALHSEELDTVRAWFPLINVPNSPLISVRSNLDDGILYRSISQNSLKRDIVMTGIYNPVSAVLVTGILTPLYSHMRAKSEETAIYNNLRMLRYNARQYAYDHNLKVVPVRMILGPGEGKRIPAMASVAGERYDLLVYEEYLPFQVTTKDGRVIEFNQ